MTPVLDLHAGMSVGEALAAFVEQLHADGRSLHTVMQYERHVALLGTWHRGSIGEITPLGLAAFMNRPEVRLTAGGSPKSQTTLNALRSSMRGFFGYLHAAGAIPANPARLLRRAMTDRPLRPALGESEIQEILKGLAGSPTKERDRVLILLLASTGLRVGSAVGLDVEDIDLKERMVHVRRAKGDHGYTTYLSEGVARALEGYLSGRTQGPLFMGSRGERMTTRQAARRFKAAGARKSLHGLRHAFARRLLERVQDLSVVAAALGHRSLLSTMAYVNIAPRRCIEGLFDLT